MILVLCEDYDISALWAAEALRLRHHDVTVVTGSALASATWEHRVSTSGADWAIRLEDGTSLRSDQMRGVLNRISAVPSAWQRRYGGPDRDYAMQEMHAFYLSWLHALPRPIVNPATPQGLCGNWRHPSAWTALAIRAGMPVRPYRQTSDDDPAAPWHRQPAGATVHVVGSRVIGAEAIVALHHTACVRLAEAAGVTLLGIDFAPDGQGWKMTGASVMPDLTGGGEALVDALVGVLVP